jgi:hypothetical protein
MLAVVVGQDLASTGAMIGAMTDRPVPPGRQEEADTRWLGARFNCMGEIQRRNDPVETRW